jgi:hypothetical protein
MRKVIRPVERALIGVAMAFIAFLLERRVRSRVRPG